MVKKLSYLENKQKNKMTEEKNSNYIIIINRNLYLGTYIVISP